MKNLCVLLLCLVASVASAQYTPPASAPPFSLSSEGVLAITGTDGSLISFSAGAPLIHGEYYASFSFDNNNDPLMTSSWGMPFVSWNQGTPFFGLGTGACYTFDVSGNPVIILQNGLLGIGNDVPLVDVDPSLPGYVYNHKGVWMFSGSTEPWAPAYSGSNYVPVTGGTLSLTVSSLSGIINVPGAEPNVGVVLIGVPSNFPVGAVATPTVTASGTVRVVVTSGIALSATNTLIVPTGTYQIRILP